MQTPSKLTLLCTALLFGIGWVGIRTAQALQETEKPAATADREKGSDKETPAPVEPAPKPEEMAEADALIQKARSALLNDRVSLQADLAQTIQLNETRKLTSEGTYLAGKFPRLKLSYTIRVGQMQGFLEEVCDGQILHTQKRVAKVGAEKNTKDLDQEYTRRDVQRILGAVENTANLSTQIQVAELGIGGLPAILASIDRSMIGQKVTQEEVNGQMCQVFHGRWDRELLEKYKRAVPQQGAQLEAFLPDRVRVSFAADTLVPVKIVYLVALRDEKGAFQGERPVMTLEFKNIVLDKELPVDAFDYTLPAGAEERDMTQDYISMMKETSRAIEAAPPEKPKAPKSPRDGALPN